MIHGDKDEDAGRRGDDVGLEGLRLGVKRIARHLGLLTGRLVSFIVDGQPAPTLTSYAAVEFAVVLIACWVYTRPE